MANGLAVGFRAGRRVLSASAVVDVRLIVTRLHGFAVCSEMQRFAEICREMQRFAEKCREMQRFAEKCSQENRAEKKSEKN